MFVQTSSIQAISINTVYLRAKRILDIIFTLLLIVPLAIVFAFVAVTICLDSGGPIFFRQKRVGLNGKEFTLLKFRTMHHHSDESIHRQAIELYMQGEALGEGNSIQFKLHNDPRITRIGHFLRKTSIDELPQFWNVLCGEMSLVGPRPPVPYEVEKYSPNDLLRLSGKPGLTGIWQVYGRSRVTFQEMVEMDIAYLRRQSILLDLKLILLTVPVMVLGRGGA
ncbi:MAG TPA: sugar transferase [Ktedonobacteraceae bacterium]|jgi:lipopolysaccharide/colanic/teichoic acid biosynthesis glycosyltransferase|nr:sugar transferase [Ktedonobacteraceae bacterium]